MTDHYHEALERAAKLWNVDSGYWDIWGKYHTAPPETIQAILQCMGVGAGSAEQVERSIAERRKREWERLLEPCLVISENQKPPICWMHVPAEHAGATASVEVCREDGSRQVLEYHLAELPVAEAAEVSGRAYLRKQLTLPELPLGYHEIRARLARAEDTMRLIVTPDQAYRHPVLASGGRAAGVAVALYGLRSARNWGCGDLRDLREAIDWTADQAGAGFVALNPLHAIPNRRPFNTSPYLPNSVFYQNFLYLDIEGIEDFQRSKRAQRCWKRPENQAELEALRATPLVEYERVSAVKLRFLKLAFAAFLREWRGNSARAEAFRTFLKREGELLERYALYCALDERLHQHNPDLWIWPDWPEPYRDPESAETQAFRKKHWRLVLFYQYVQWQLDLQLAAAQKYALERGLAIGLYHDLALATDRCGSDLWAYRPFFVSGCRVGSPPDDFSPKGQDWGFPPPHSEHHRETGYRLFAESIRQNCRHGGALRIDHVMRFFRLFWIPDGQEPTYGSYVRERYEDLVRILALESVRNRVVIVGEDLGTVEPFVRETLECFGILGYRLFYFEKNAQGGFKRAQEYSRQALVSSTTHDLPTLAGFWVNRDIEARREAGVFSDEAGYRAALEERAVEKQKMLDVLFQENLLPDWFPRQASQIPELTGELHNGVIGFLALAASELLVVNQEDLTKETEQQNLPATTWQYPNWSRKMKFTLEQLRSDPLARSFTAMFRTWLERSGRLNRPGTTRNADPAR